MTQGQAEGELDGEQMKDEEDPVAQQSEDEEMPDIALLDEDAGDQEEFDYTDIGGKMAGNEGEFMEEQDDEAQIGAEAVDNNEADQEAAQSEESSAIRSVQVPHRDEPEDDDGEFIGAEEGMRPRGGTDSEESDDNVLMDDANNL